MLFRSGASEEARIVYAADDDWARRDSVKTLAPEIVWHDWEFVLSREFSADGGFPSLVLAPSLPRPARSTLQKPAHAYSLRDELDAAWAARPLRFVAPGWSADDRGPGVGALGGATAEGSSYRGASRGGRPCEPALGHPRHAARRHLPLHATSQEVVATGRHARGSRRRSA